MMNEKIEIKSRNNNVITRAWEASSRKHSEQRTPEQFQSFRVMAKYLKLYCQYSSLSSFKYLADPQKTWYERILWITIHCVTISSLIFMVYVSYQEFYTSPILTSMDTDSYRTTDLLFPAIAICSVNRISKQSATELANNIFNANITDQSVTEILDLVKQLGNLYSSEFIMDEDRNVEIDLLLTTYFKGPYDITEIMKDLSPQCATMLLKCKLHGTERNCTTLFEFRKTQDGFCCTFNYLRESDDIPVIKPELMKPTSREHNVSDLGIEQGLTVVMDPFFDDYFYPILPVKGWKVIVFDPHDYPDVTSGSVTEVLALPRAETYIDVTAVSFYSTKIIEKFHVSKRNCRFAKEQRTTYAGKPYTYSDCIVDCKIHDTMNLCGCRPFFYPRRGEKEYAWRICTNADLDCMAKYKTKWWTVFPHENNAAIQDSDWALHCQNCYPACQDTSYDILSSKSYLASGMFKTDLMWNQTITNEGMLHMFFSKYGSIRLKQDVTSYWYELLSDIGGICGVFIGFSLISVVEMLYFLALVLRDLLFKESIMRMDDDDHEEKDDGDHDGEKIQSIHDQTITTIYWGELLPRSWHSARYGRFIDNTARY